MKTNEIPEEALRQRLVHIMTPWMNEGFFAKMVVLVEGIKDRALIMGQALSKQLDLEGMGVAVIPCGDKMGIPEVISIFKSLKVPLYVVWDSDTGKPEGADTNKAILRSFGCHLKITRL